MKSLEFFPRLEADGFPRRDSHLRASSRVPSDAGFPRTHVEDSEATQLNAISLAERLLHGLEDCLHRHLRFRLCDSRSVNDFVNDVELDQAAAAQKDNTRLRSVAEPQN